MPHTITDAQVEEVVVRTLEEVPEGATHWSKRDLARQVSISPASASCPPSTALSYFRDFLDEFDRQTDPGLAVHVICDNLSAHKVPVVQRWLLAHPRVQLHFTPTYSWISQVNGMLGNAQRHLATVQA